MLNHEHNETSVLEFNVNIMDFKERMSTGEIGKCFFDVFGGDEVSSYFIERIINWAVSEIESKQETIDIELLETVFKPESLIMNFQINAMKVIFSLGINEWLREDGNLEELIIKNITVDIFKQVVDSLRIVLQHLINNSNVGNGSCGGNGMRTFVSNKIDEYLRTVDPIRIMKTNGNNRLN